MTDLAVIVEGQTEEAFVDRVLRPHLEPRGLSAWAVLPGRGPRRRGGRWAWPEVRRDAERLLKERRARRCALLFDYSGLPPDWPGKAQAASEPVEHRAAIVEEALRQDLAGRLGGAFNPALFLPHIQLHEFEARLFSDCVALGEAIGVDPGALGDIVAECGSPEAIDDDNPPSRRLQALAPGYRKIEVGATVSARIGLDAMRRRCPHFAAWLARVEAAAVGPDSA